MRNTEDTLSRHEYENLNKELTFVPNAMTSAQLRMGLQAVAALLSSICVILVIVSKLYSLMNGWMKQLASGYEYQVSPTQDVQ
jgi:hypothetical protein